MRTFFSLLYFSAWAGSLVCLCWLAGPRWPIAMSIIVSNLLLATLIKYRSESRASRASSLFQEYGRSLGYPSRKK